MVAKSNLTYDLHTVVPAWLPYNDIADQIVEETIQQLNYPEVGPKSEKYRVAVASFLKACQSVLACQSRDKPQHLGIRYKSEAWSLYPLVGKDIRAKVFRDLVGFFEAMQVSGSGDSQLFRDEQGKWHTVPIMSMYTLETTNLPERLNEAKFIEVGRPLVKVNRAETRQQSKKRKKENKPKPFLKRQQARQLDGKRLKASESRIQRLNDYWRQHPLILPNGNAAACATRVFHDQSFFAGGRLYGAWTMLDNKNDQRLMCRIVDEPVCELDIRASQPTLLSCLLGIRMNNVSDQNTWHDPYLQLTGLEFYDNDAWGEFLEEFTAHGETQTDPYKRPRLIAKAVVMEMIGSGDHNKSNPTDDLVEKAGVTQEEWNFFREKLKEVIPALNMLEPRYDNKGNLEGVLNGPVFLSYHESEMTLEAVEELHDRDIPAYPVHDCLMVRVSDAKLAADVYRDTIRRYCEEIGGLNVLVPLGCEVAEGVPKDDLPKRDDLRGEYLSDNRIT